MTAAVDLMKFELRHVTAKPGERIIDGVEWKRKKPMRVLVLGMCRTGTSSIALALTKLGYTPHHMTSIMNDPDQVPYWHEAINVSFLPDNERPVNQRGLKPYGRAEFDKLLADYDAVTDLPGALFVEQLTEAYPDAKVVLTNRAYESWEKSMQNSIWLNLTSKLPIFCRKLNLTPVAPLLHFVHAIFRVHNNNHYGGPEARAAYYQHYEHVRAVVPKENLLEFGPKFEWEPLCKFLGHEVPDEPYPWTNDAKMITERINRVWWVMATYLAGMVVVPVGVAGFGLGNLSLAGWYFRIPQSEAWSCLGVTLSS